MAGSETTKEGLKRQLSAGFEDAEAVEGRLRQQVTPVTAHMVAVRVRRAAQAEVAAADPGSGPRSQDEDLVPESMSNSLSDFVAQGQGGAMNR